MGPASLIQRRSTIAPNRASGRPAGSPAIIADSTKPLSTKNTWTAQSGLQNMTSGVRDRPVAAAAAPCAALPLSSAGWNASTKWQNTTASAATPRRPSRWA